MVENQLRMGKLLLPWERTPEGSHNGGLADCFSSYCEIQCYAKHLDILTVVGFSFFCLTRHTKI